MADLICLETFPPTGKTNPQWAVDLLSEGHLEHPGRMRVTVVNHALDWLRPQLTVDQGVIADPMSGPGTTVIAAQKCGFVGFVGCELDSRWLPMLKAVVEKLFGVYGYAFEGHSGLVPIEEPRFPYMPFRTIFLSPPFPNAKSPGKQPYQDHVIKDRGSKAGLPFIGQKLWRTQKGFKFMLGLCLRPWVWELHSSDYVLVHIKNYVRKNKEIRVDQWTAEVLEGLGCDVLGYLAAPLDYLSHWQQFRIYPQREIRWREHLTEPAWDKGKVRVTHLEYLECGHERYRRANTVATVTGCCVECGVIPSICIVQEERIVVGRMR